MNAKKHRVLIFPAGSEIGLEIFNSLKYSHHVEIYGASGKSDHASFVYNAYYYIEDDLYIDQADFIDRFNELLCKNQIEYIYPTHDSISCFLSKHQSDLSAKVLTSCYATNLIARQKNRTYDLFKSYSFCPKIFDIPYKNLTFPVFLKPSDGQGGKGAFIAEDQGDLNFYLKKNNKLLISEFLPGEELSVDCFTNFHGELQFIGPRTRERIQMGVSFRSTKVSLTNEIRQIAESINKMVDLDGAWFFQVKKDHYGQFKLMEFAPRQSSTMGLYRHSGINFALLTLFNALKIPVELIANEYNVQLDRCLHNRFKMDLKYHRVYIDFDETLVVGQQVYDRAMAFLYQCRNKGINIVLITKHQKDIRKTLYDFCIPEKIFEQIIHLSEADEKWKFINPEGAIFIDNYWFDRRMIKDKLNIPVFDVDAIECLLC